MIISKGHLINWLAVAENDPQGNSLKLVDGGILVPRNIQYNIMSCVIVINFYWLQKVVVMLWYAMHQYQ